MPQAGSQAALSQAKTVRSARIPVTIDKKYAHP
jgi:hypothetical protein